MNRLTRLFLPAVLAVLLLGCAGDADNQTSTRAVATADQSRVSASDVRAAGTSERLIASVVQSAQQEPYRFEWALALSGLPSTSVTLRGTGAVDPAQDRYEMSIDLSQIFAMLAAPGVLSPAELQELSALRESGSMDFLIQGSTAYVHSPLIARELGASTPWISVSASDFPQVGMLGGMGQVLDPTELVATLQGAGELKVGGSESVRGAPTTRWDGTIDLLKLAEGQFTAAGVDAADFQELAGMLGMALPGVTRSPVSLWVSGDNRLRRFEIRMAFPTGAAAAGQDASMTMRYELFDFGSASVRPAPSPHEVTDLGSALSPTPPTLR
jgi:hypothetical protein